MNKREMKKFEKSLQDERDRLSVGIRRFEKDTLYQPVSDNTTDFTSYAEVGTDNFDRETALNIASGEASRLQEVADALARIEAGTYGTCEGCEAEIPRKRLEVFPAARYCISCQARLEKEGAL